MFRMTIEIYTMGSNCNLQTFVHIESDFFGSDVTMMAVILCWRELNLSHFYS